MVEIQPAELSDLPLYREHWLRHSQESGKDGDVIFFPEDEPAIHTLEYMKREKKRRWNLKTSEVGWERCWVLKEIPEKRSKKTSAKIVGDIKIGHGIPLKSTLHRATLSLGIERAYRGQGHGQGLIETVIAWAQKETLLEFIDLFVFEHNKPAHALYKKLGFTELGRVPDRFRVHGQKITDIHMTLPLR
jgi:RimJ/RimL family protein N-acetyltransferase